MKRSRILALLLVLVVSFVLLSGWLRSPPRLTFLINGNPAANITVADFQAMAPRKTDSTGTITLEGDSEQQHAVLVPLQGGIHRQVAESHFDGVFRLLVHHDENWRREA